MPHETSPSFSVDGPHASELDVLMADITALRNDFRTLGTHASESARSRVEQARMRVAELAKAAKVKGEHARDLARTQIEDHPFAAVGIALGVGVLLGVVIARR